jgi:UDP-GlcNAc:undecaprenyl-phosphate GlcNAc-1-phosphate transferase
MLVIGGAIDDRYQTGVTLKIATEVLAALIVIEALDFRITYLGDLVGLGMIEMPAAVSYAFTIVSIFGLVNAFNMLDGVDGLLSALVLTTIGAFHIITGTSVTVTAAYLSASVFAFLIANISSTSWLPKCFLGDAGSRLLGFIAVCCLLSAASAQIGGAKLINPATALFLVAMPLFDMVFVTLKRTQQGRSPFHADRSHIHHLLINAGASQFSTVAAIVGANLAMACLGLTLQLQQVREPYQMAIFCCLFLTYGFVINRAWNKVTK